MCDFARLPILYVGLKCALLPFMQTEMNTETAEMVFIGLAVLAYVAMVVYIMFRLTALV